MTALLWLALSAGPAPGLYSAAFTHRHGLLQLEVKANGEGHLRQVVSLHLPPAEIESLDVKLTEKGGQLCLSPAPATVEPCLKITADGLLATLKNEKVEVTLKLRPAAP